MINHVIIRSRGSGKTDELLKIADGTNAVIVCHTRRRAVELKEIAEARFFKIKDPVSIDMLVDTNWRPKERDTELMFDDVDLMLEQLARGIPIKTITLSKPE